MKTRHFLYAMPFVAAAALVNACAVGDFSPGAGGDNLGGSNGGAGGDNGAEDGKKGPVATGEGGTSGGTTSSDTGGSAVGGGPLGGTGGSNDGGTGGTEIQCGDEGVPYRLFLSSDDSSSMGSPAIAREYLLADMAPPKNLIRTWEFLNYYRVRYPVPVDDAVSIYGHFAPTDKADRYRFMIGVQAFKPERPTMALTFVADVSGSLIGEGIAREREAVRVIAGQLRAGDRVSFVTWANSGNVLLENHLITGPNDPELLGAADKLLPGGGSDLHTGLLTGYQLAATMSNDKRLSRVILMSDGGANVGVVDKEEIAKAAKNGDDQGIYLVGIGVGPAQAYSDDLMNTVTDAGRGAYVYLPSEGEAQAVLGDRFDEVMDVAARSVKVELTLPSYFGFKEFNGEGMSTNEDDVPPQHLAPGDSMIFDQILGVQPGSTVCDVDLVTVRVTWKNPLLHASESSKSEAGWTRTLAQLKGEPWQLLKADAIVAYARFLADPTQAAYERATDALAKALKEPTLSDDLNAAELDDIEMLLGHFPKDAIH